MLKKLLALVVLLGLAGYTVGCEAEGKIDDDEVELDIDD
jgi:hypothetical protein